MKKTKVLQVLLLSGILSEAELIKETFDKSSREFNLQVAEDENNYRLLLEKNSFDVILADYNFPFLSAPVALKLALAYQPAVPYIVISGSADEYNAVELMRQGAVDVVFKDRIFSLPFSVSRALREANYLNQLQKTRKQLRNQKRHHGSK
jgi:DNA-binding NtrC family response regulator